MSDRLCELIVYTFNELPTRYVFLPRSHNVQVRPEGMDIPLNFFSFSPESVLVSMEGFLRAPCAPVVAHLSLSFVLKLNLSNLNLAWTILTAKLVEYLLLRPKLWAELQQRQCSSIGGSL